MSPQTVTSQVVTRTECWYEYSATVRETLEQGHRRVDDADDPRWDDEMRNPPFRAGPRGYLQVAEVTRLVGPDGKPDMTDILKKRAIKGSYCHMNKAREVIRLFNEKQAAGDDKPWDHERFYRDAMEKAESAEREGRERDLEIVRDTLRDAVSPGGSLAPRPAPPSVGGDKK